MNLTHVKELRCPVCGGDTVREEVETSSYGEKPRVQVHVNGGTWETRTFLCGAKARFIPNFGKTEVTECPNSPKAVDVRKKREAAKKKVLDLVAKLECDYGFRKRLRSQLDYVSVDLLWTPERENEGDNE